MDLNNTMIITKTCASQIKKLQNIKNNKELKLRITVDSGGCNGFQYMFDMSRGNIKEEDVVFKKHGACVIVDKESFDLIKGSVIDYKEELIRSSFVILNNPQSESACGCGSSFAIKNFTENPAID